MSRWKSGEELMRKTLLRGLKPIPKLTVSAWADRYRVLPSESAEPGRWRTSRVPYMRSVMDAFTDPAVEKVVVKSAAQIGKSECLLNVLGRYAQLDPCTAMIIQPTLEMATDFSKARLTKMIEDTKTLTGLFYGGRTKAATRDANQTLLSKFYTGGRIVLAGANSPAGLASRPIRILLCDEVDRFPPSAGAEGDPLSIAAKRTSSYWNRKVGIFSTPTVVGLSRIDVEYELGTQEEWRHQCPNCGEYQRLTHEQMGGDSEISWRCPDCGQAYSEVEMKNARQKYVAQNPDVKGTRSFFISGFSSPWVSWATIMKEWRDAQGRPELEKVVYNTRFGLSYELKGAFAEPEQFESRLEEYGSEVPRGVLLLTAGVDVQEDRLEYEIVGWGDGEESWGIVRGKIYGSPQAAETWSELDAVLDREYRSREETLTVTRAFIDSGFMTSEVYKYCRQNVHKGRFAIKGYGGFGRRLVDKTVMQKGVALTLLGVNEGKEMVMSRLMVGEIGAQYFHFGKDDKYIRRRGYDAAYFKGLTSERKVRHQRGGMVYEMWEPLSHHIRNEPLDLRVYALAAMKSFGIEDWSKLREPEEEAAPVKIKAWEAGE